MIFLMVPVRTTFAISSFSSKLIVLSISLQSEEDEEEERTMLAAVSKEAEEEEEEEDENGDGVRRRRKHVNTRATSRLDAISAMVVAEND
jgi:hypothetical protein